jgi:hypothetical protein
MSDSAQPNWILPADIPFAQLKAKDLEECIYWLLDAMGARDLEWRIGGEGGGAADGGRDLEATFYVPSPDGDLEPQRWWVECKGRQGTVEPDQVKSAVNNATMIKNLGYLVIATNTGFSNPTRDWVKAWQSDHPLPKIKLWDRAYLERLLSQHPGVVLRLFSEALSPAGVLKAVSYRFWERIESSPIRALRTLWAEREQLEIEPKELVALVANEVAHGDLRARPWAAATASDDLAQGVHAALANAPYLVLRASKIGVAQDSLFKTFAHLILAAVQVLQVGGLATLVTDSLARRSERTLPDEVIDIFLTPILHQILGELQDVCSSDCDRVFTELTTIVGSDDPIQTYWRAINPKGRVEDDEPGSVLRMEKHDGPCKVGYCLDRENGCPLFSLEPSNANLPECLNVVERVSAFRYTEAMARE